VAEEESWIDIARRHWLRGETVSFDLAGRYDRETGRWYDTITGEPLSDEDIDVRRSWIREGNLAAAYARKYGVTFADALAWQEILLKEIEDLPKEEQREQIESWLGY